MFGHFIFSFYNERKFSVDCCVDLSIIDFHFRPIHFNHMSVYFSLTREIAVDSIYHYKNSSYKSIIWRRLRWPNRRPEIHYFQIKFTNTYVENIVHKWTLPQQINIMLGCVFYWSIFFLEIRKYRRLLWYSHCSSFWESDIFSLFFSSRPRLLQRLVLFLASDGKYVWNKS